MSDLMLPIEAIREDVRAQVPQQPFKATVKAINLVRGAVQLQIGGSSAWQWYRCLEGLPLDHVSVGQEAALAFFGGEPTVVGFYPVGGRKYKAPIHTHEKDAEGGQLDWDDIWSDAVHSHNDDDEGGNIIVPKVSMGIVNGGHGDFASAQAAVDWAAANGYYHIYFPPGTYDNITVSTNSTVIEGSGATAIFKDTAGHCIEIDAHFVTVKTLRTVGTDGGGNAYDCIHVTTDVLYGCFIRGVYFASSDRYGLYADGGWLTMNNCVFSLGGVFDSNRVYLDNNSDDCAVVGNANLDGDSVDNGAGNVIASNS